MAGLCPVIVFSEEKRASLEKPVHLQVNCQNTEISAV
jgi:hypothetical protein